MKLFVSVVLFALCALLSCTAVRAESLCCNGQIASEGDSRLSLIYKCGESLLKDSKTLPENKATPAQGCPIHG